jgi:preprotein translocase subunit SecF
VNLRHAIDTYRGHTVPHFRLIDQRNRWFAFSGVLILLSLGGLIFRHLNLSIEFEGGAQISYPLESDVSVQDITAVLARNGRGDAEVQIIDGNQVSIRTESFGPEASSTALPSNASASASVSPSSSASTSASPSGTSSASAGTSESPAGSSPDTSSSSSSPGLDTLKAELAEQAGIAPEDVNVEDIGPTWGAEISKKALRGLLVVLIAIMLYITLRFELKMAIGAIIALVHDVLITAGVYALTGREVTPETVIAILTILGFSLYDTVVIYDKVQENTASAALVAKYGYAEVVNRSLNQVLMRSVNTSLVVLLPILSLLLFGGATLKDFAFAMFVGTATGAYSSIFIAAPILTILKGRETRYRQPDARRARSAAVPARVPAGTGDGSAAAATSDAAATAATARTGSATQARPRPKSKKRPPAKRKRR